MTNTWKLQGITAGTDTCDHCGRTLARLFRVASPEGSSMVVGRVCSAKLTGYKWSVAQAERIEAHRAAEAAAAVRFGALWTEAKTLGASHVANVAGCAGEALNGMRNNEATADEIELAEYWLAKARRNLAKA